MKRGIFALSLALTAVTAFGAGRPRPPLGEGAGLRTAIFDAGQHGDLPPVEFEREAATVDPAGLPLGPNAPRYASPRVIASLGEWEAANSSARSVLAPWSGFDRDGETPVLALYNSFNGRMDVWVGAPVADAPSFTVPMRRVENGTAVRDALYGDALQRPHHAYDPKAGTMLPGALVLLCERKRDVNENPQQRHWSPEGVSVLVYQHGADGVWRWSILFDGPVFAAGWKRLRAAALLGYYPRELQSPLTRAFIPFVDYVMDAARSPQKRGGQLFLVEAVRATPDDDWSFGPVASVYEHARDGEHFHSAAWTPRGVILSVGDQNDLNEVKLFTCDDWDDYANPARWTGHDAFHGAAGGPGQFRVANQFWGCIPGRDLNTVIVGADVVSGSLFEITVPPDPATGARFRRLHGQEVATGATSNVDYAIAEWMHRPAPERSTAVVARSFIQGSSFGQDYSRVLFSDDAEHFTPVARIPGGQKAATALLYGDSIVMPYLGSQAGPVGIWSMPRPTLTAPRRGLLVAPGGRNRMVVTGTGELVDIAPPEGAELTYMPTASHPLTGLPLPVPTLGPVYRVTRDDGAPGTVVLDTLIAGTAAALSPGSARVPLWVYGLGAEGVWLTAELSDGAVTRTQKFKLVERDQWVPCLLTVDTSAFAEGYAPRLRLRIAAGEADRYACDFLVAVDGLYVNEAHGYPLAPMTDGAGDTTRLDDERVAMPLPALGKAWTVELELRVPPTGMDMTMGDLAAAVPLATVYANADEHLLLEANVAAGTLVGRMISGGAETATITVPGFRMNRLDQVWIRAAYTGSAVNLFAVSGGSAGDGVAAGTARAAFTALPTELRIGDADFATAGPIELLRIGVDPTRALGPTLVDCDRDGVPDDRQIAAAPWQDADGDGILDACAERGDLDGDGDVDVIDLLALIGAWGACDDPPAACPADLDGNGVVGFRDLLTMFANWG